MFQIILNFNYLLEYLEDSSCIINFRGSLEQFDF